MKAKRTKPARTPSRSRPAKAPAGKKASGGKFVGRDPSPVLDRYPPKDPHMGVRGPPAAAKPSTAPKPAASGGQPTPAVPAPATPPPPAPLISLQAPFDLDSFSQMLGENLIQVKVPREDLGEVLRRITDFMGFGIYVYRFSIRPEPGDQLKRFVVELERVDYSPSDRDWVPFEEKGRSESPFGPGSTR